MAPIAPGALAESASAKMRFLYSAEYWRRLALTTTSGSVSGVNYFFALTTTISPGQRQLLLALRAARSAAARPLLKCPPLHRRGDPEGSSIKLVSSLLPQAVGAVEKWESWFWISTFPPPTIPDSLLACCSV